MTSADVSVDTGDDDDVIFYDPSPISGAALAFVALAVLLVFLLAILGSYGPKWGGIYHSGSNVRSRRMMSEDTGAVTTVDPITTS